VCVARQHQPAGEGWVHEIHVLRRHSQRFLTMGQVGEILNTSNAQVYAIVRSGSLRAIKIGGPG